MTNVAVIAQHQRVPLGLTEDGKYVLIEREWLNALTAIAQALDAAGTVTNAATLGAGLVIIGAGGDGVAALPAGVDGQVLTQTGGVATWAPAAGGGGLVITEVDGVPSATATKLILPNGTLSYAGTDATYTPTATSNYTKGAAWDASPVGLIVPVGASPMFPAPCQAAGTILAAYAIGQTVAGSATVEVWKSSSGVPTSANKISGTNPITLSAATSSVDTGLATWSTTAVAAGDRFGFKVLTSTLFSFLGVYLLIG